ncbi:MAG: flagellar hook capping family protein [Alphaproteobacteria bacterium]|jgi:flagellar basal-body rod modification protein FlgD|nr:flagellar hook capping family protein [Alphaproteobacteria bacterium]QQS58482.1 MAG: flagellar hook capping family protein [Alphaproteobacteria bacterium]
MASDVTINNALQAQQNTANSSSQLAEDFDDFLQLLTTQLQNQDPLSPLDTNEFTSQLVQFAGVEQQININSKLNNLVSLGIGNSFSSALNYVGKDVSYLSAEMYYDGAKPVEINYAIEGVSNKTTINIFSEDGELVFSQDVSDDEGVENFTWNGQKKGGGTVPAGTYNVRVDAIDADDKSLKTSTVVTGNVKGIETQNGQTFLLVGERAVSIANIINVQTPKPTTTGA